MGMGYGAGFADVIEEDEIKKLCPKEFYALRELVDKDDQTDWDSLARAGICCEIEGECGEEISKAYEKLCRAFKKKTGLSLSINFHDKQDEGDRYDEVDGPYWIVDGMYELTPAGRKMEGKVQRRLFVHFG